MWHRRLKGYQATLGFKENYYDPSLFIRKIGENITILFVYVDDIVVTGSLKQEIEDTIHNLKKEFVLKKLDELSFFLGIQVQQSRQALFLFQQQYLINLLES